MGWSGLDWVGLDQTALDWAGMDWPGCGLTWFAGLDRTGLDTWAGLG